MGIELLLAAQAKTSAENIGLVIGVMIVVAIASAGIAKCSAIAKRETTCSKCVYALAVFLSAWMIRALLRAYLAFAEAPPMVVYVCYLLLACLALVAMILAIVGLTEMRMDSRFVQGRSQAIWALVLCGICLTTEGLSIAVRLRDGANGISGQNQPGVHQAGQNQPGVHQAGQSVAGLSQSDATESQEFADLNFRYHPPEGSSWRRIENVAAFNEDAALMYAMDRRWYFMIIAEATGAEMDNEALIEVAKINFQSAYPNASFTRRDDQNHGGIEGAVLEADSNDLNDKIRYEYWLAVHNGYAYQFVVVMPEDAPRHGEHSVETIVSGFELINPDQLSPRIAASAAKSVRSEYGYETDWDRSEWSNWPEMAVDQPLADSGALYGNRGAQIVVASSLYDETMTLETIASAMLGSIGIEYPSANCRMVKTTIDGKPAVKIGTSVVDEFRTEFAYEIHVLQHEGNALMLAVWVVADAQDKQQVFDDARQRFRICDAGRGSTLITHSNEEELRHAAFLNEAGLVKFGQSQFRIAGKWFRSAWDLDKQTPNYLLNAVIALREEGRDHEAIELIDANAQYLEENDAAFATRAHMLAEAGRVEEAVDQFEAYFGHGYHDDEYFSDFIELLIGQDRQDEALAHVERARRDADSPSLIALKSRVLASQKEYGEALQLLGSVEKDFGENMELFSARLTVLEMADRVQDAVALLQAEIDRKGESSELLYMRALYECDLKQLQKAKKTLERASDLDPANVEISELLVAVSSRMGRGDISSIRTPIQPVPFPVDPTTLTTRKPTTDISSGAVYRQRTAAYKVKPGHPHKRTDRYVVDVTDESGVQSFSSFQLEFNPLHEHVFINRLHVLDEKGKVVSEGDVDDYYVIDDTAEGVASYAKLLVAPVSGLRVGHRIEMTITREDKRVYDEAFFDDFLFSGVFPHDMSAVAVNTSKGEFSWQGSDMVESRKVGDHVILFTKVAPPKYEYERMQPAVSEFLPYAVFGTGATDWQTEGRDYYQDIATRLEPSDKAKEVLVSLLDGSEDRQRTIAKIVQFVHDELTYHAIEFGVRGQIMPPVEETISNRYGDCKDHSLLLYQLFRAADIPAELALVKSDGALVESLPSLDQFDHMIVYVPASGSDMEAFYDGTQHSLPPHLAVPSGMAGKQVLILDRDKPRLATIGDYPRPDKTITIVRSVEVRDDGDCQVNEKIEMRDYIGSSLRSFLSLYPASEHQSTLEGLLRNQQPQIEFDLIDVHDLEETSRPLVLELDYVIRRAFRRQQQTLFGDCPAIVEDYFFNPTPYKERKTPFRIEAPIHLHSKVFVSVPNGLSLRTESAGTQRRRSDVLASRCNVARPDQSHVTIDAEMRRRSGLFPASQYADFSQAAQQFIEDLTIPLEVDRGGHGE